MKITTELTEKQLTVIIAGRIDSETAPMLEKTLKGNFEIIDTLIFDFAELDFMSSAGLRILLGAQKKLNAQGGKLIIKNVNQTVREIFEITGMLMIFNLA